MKPYSSKITIDLTNEAKGVYFLQAIMSSDLIYKKFILN
jgi:hypothetical protein